MASTKIKLTNNVADVDIISTPPTDGQALIYSTATSNWIPGDVASGGVGGGVTAYSTIDDLPLSENSTGDLAFVIDTNRLYLWNSVGWYNIALINTTPTITGGYESNYIFELDGTPIEITLVGNDPEGIPVTWSYTSTNIASVATITQVDNVFTVTPSTDRNDQGTFSVTWKLSDGVNIGTAASEFTLQFEVIDSKYTTLLAKATAATQNATFVDSSTNNHTITANGDVYQGTFSPYRAGGYSMYFDGSGGDYYYAAASSDFDMDVNEWCIECWVYITDLSADRGIAATWQTGGQFALEIKSTGAVSMDIRDRTTTASASGVITANQWYHIAVVRDNSGASDVVTIYVDGVDVANQSFTSGSDFIYYNNALKDLRIGVHFDGTTPFKGYISNFRYLIGDTVYRSSFTPPTAPLEDITGTKLLTANRPYAVDTSSYARTINVTGTPFIKLGGPFDYRKYNAVSYGGSAYFDGTGDRLSIASDSSLSFGSEDFTIECWYNPTSKVQNYPRIFGAGTAEWNTNDNWALLDRHNDASTKFGFAAVAIAGNTLFLQSTTTVQNGTWYHIAVVRSGSSFAMFINGSREATYTSSTALTSSASVPVFVGGLDANVSGNAHANGYVSNARFVKGTAVYDPAATSITVPTSPLTAITNTSLLLNFTNAGVQDLSQVSNLKLVGNATGSNTQTKNALYSMYFDGAGDYTVASNEIILSSSDFTVELWWYPTSTSRQALIHGSFGYDYSWGIDFSSVGSQKIGIWASSTGSSWNLVNSDGGGTGTGTQTVNQNAWNHIVFTRSGTTLRSFVNGVLDVEITGVSAAIATRTTNNPIIGNWFNNTYSVSGYIEDLRITKGLARYTANFTPPTSELLG